MFSRRSERRTRPAQHVHYPAVEVSPPIGLRFEVDADAVGSAGSLGGPESGPKADVSVPDDVDVRSTDAEIQLANGPLTEQDDGHVLAQESFEGELRAVVHQPSAGGMALAAGPRTVEVEFHPDDPVREDTQVRDFVEASLGGQIQVGKLSADLRKGQGVAPDVGEPDLTDLADLIDPSALVGIAAGHIATAIFCWCEERQSIKLPQCRVQIDVDRHAVLRLRRRRCGRSGYCASPYRLYGDRVTELS